MFGFSVGLWDGSGFQLVFVIFQVFQLSFGIVRIFSWRLGLFWFSVGVWDCSGFQLAFGNVRVFSLLVGWFGFPVDFWVFQVSRMVFAIFQVSQLAFGIIP